MEKGLLMLTLSMLCLWALLDEFFGSKRISGVASSLTPSMGLTDILPEWKDDEQAQESKEKGKKALEDAEERGDINEDAKDHLQDAIDEFYGPGPS